MRIAWVALVAVAPACAQPLIWDFEDNNWNGWTQTGNAFTGQPFCKKAGEAEFSSTRFADSRLGGNYWQGLEYPLGQHGNCVVTSLLKAPAGEPWSMTSPEFTVPGDARYLTILLGGTNDVEHERVEFEVQREGVWNSAYKATPPGGDQLIQKVIEIAPQYRGMTARIRILDSSASGHINVDYIQISPERPDEVHVPVWGYGDYHTHPMTRLAFGSNDKRHIIFGESGGNYDDYLADPKLVVRDIGRCERGHGGGYLAEAFINNAQLFSESIGSVIKAFLLPHGRSGQPDYKAFPDHLMGAHQQMHVTMIRRNYEGGLRLMVALVTDNWGAAFLTGVAENGKVPLVSEPETIAAQLDGLRDLARKNSSWMELALTPADARRIIQQNKLAIIPGVELDRLGSYDPDPEKEVDFLWRQGVRAVTPIHAVDNALGSPAILNAPYNWLNDFFANDAQQVRPSGLGPPKFFEIEADDCAGNHEAEGECVVHKLDPFPQLRLIIARPIFTLFRRAPGFTITSAQTFNTGLLGQKNKHGLTPKGRDYIRALMKRGIIVDTAHMSDKSVNDAYQALGERPGYPAIISHVGFRKEGLYENPANEIPGYLASEYDISDSNIERVKNAGGVMGVFANHARINPKSIDIHISHITDDCGNSSKGFAFAYHYGQSLAPGRLGMATDMTFIPMVSPRFGPHACEGYKSFQHGQKEPAKHPNRYRPHDQKDPVLYEQYKGMKAIAKTNQKEPMKPYRMGDRVFDFNEDGLAHYGLVPDMLQDLKNVEMPKRDLQAFFGSAEAYLEMWERVERAK
jgi:microsomal dipeptidase-like Zn-dependent dipeptidase